MEFFRCFLSVTFVVLTVDQFNLLGAMMARLNNRRSYVCRRNGTFPLILRQNQGLESSL